MAALTSNELARTTSRLGVLRLGAGRLAFIPEFLEDFKRYEWERATSPEPGAPPNSVSPVWTRERD
jgi:hypothetical protein